MKDFEYKVPSPSIDENGELQVAYQNDDPVKIPDITFLYIAETDENGDVISAKGIDVANAWLMHLVINRDHQCVSLQSRSLIQYFNFLNETGMLWDEMPSRQNRRPTYRFKRYLEELYRSNDPNAKLSASTCQGYMRCVVNFYRYKLARKHPFDNPPFEHEIITVNAQGGATSMQATRSINVQTTDLRLRIAKSTTKNDVPNRLIALSKYEWQEMDSVLRKERRIIRNIDGREVIGSLAVEFSLIFLLMRYSGLRREEVRTLREELVFKPTLEELQKGYVVLRIGAICGVATKGSKEREIEIPTGLMKQLHEYTTSQRAIKRRIKYERIESKPTRIPLFLNNKGQMFSSGTLNARWIEVRKMMVKRIGRAFDHKQHNLRATYGVFRLHSLMDAGLPQSDALTFVQTKMGHSDLGTTLHYLKQVNEEACGDEKAERVYEYLFNLEDFELV
ncbi:MAG: site-specific integrase [Alteromonadaceae bacterium]|nr:site-specific integrase [Alteromonadaceae bacterium]